MEWFAPIVFVFVVTAGAVIDCCWSVGGSMTLRSLGIAMAVLSSQSWEHCLQSCSFVVIVVWELKTRLPSVRPWKPES